jgi:membrane associated rhomboid family serine protease
MPVSRYLSIWGIIVAAAAVFALEQAQQTSFSADYGAVPVEVRAAFDAVRGGNFSLDALSGFVPLVTAIFLHANAEHILFNMVFLWTFGSLTAEILGQWRALAVFFVCGVGGNIVQVWLNPASPDPIIGASGAVCGFQGVFFGLALRWQLPWVDVWPIAHPIPPLQLAAFALIGFAADMYMLANRDTQIAYGAHLGGFLTGLAVAAVITTIYPTQSSFDRSGRKEYI